MKKALLFLMISFAALSSCRQNITLQLPAYENKVAVYSILSPYNVPKVYLNLSQSYYDYGDTVGGYRWIKDASVTITDQTTGTIDTLKLDSGIEGSGPFSSNVPTWYYIGKNKAAAGHQYAAMIKYKGKVITAETTVPRPAVFNHAAYKKSIDTIFTGQSYEIQLYVNDPAGEENYYGVLKDLWATNPVQIADNYVSDAGLDGKQVEITDVYQGQINPGDSVTLDYYIETTNKATARYISDLYNQAGANSDPFSQPVVIESNVNGGLGIFGAVTPSPRVTVTIK